MVGYAVVCSHGCFIGWLRCSKLGEVNHRGKASGLLGEVNHRCKANGSLGEVNHRGKASCSLGEVNHRGKASCSLAGVTRCLQLLSCIAVRLPLSIKHTNQETA